MNYFFLQKWSFGCIDLWNDSGFQKSQANKENIVDIYSPVTMAPWEGHTLRCSKTPRGTLLRGPKLRRAKIEGKFAPLCFGPLNLRPLCFGPLNLRHAEFWTPQTVSCRIFEQCNVCPDIIMGTIFKEENISRYCTIKRAFLLVLLSVHVMKRLSPLLKILFCSFKQPYFKNKFHKIWLYILFIYLFICLFYLFFKLNFSFFSYAFENV